MADYRKERTVVAPSFIKMIDLHIHSRCSDGSLTVKELFKEAKVRHIEFMSITDHDTIDCQQNAMVFAKNSGISYIPGVELNITFSPPEPYGDKPISLDFLGYQFNIEDSRLKQKLQQVAEYRENRAAKILSRVNAEFRKEGIKELTTSDFAQILDSIDGVLGRPHIANYLVKAGIVGTRQEAFDRYLVKCNVPRYPLHAKDAAALVRDSGGIVVLAHPNDPNGTSLIKLTRSLDKQTNIIQESLLEHIDGVECWHSRNDSSTTRHYIKFAEDHDLVMTGGSDCHQKPIIMGTLSIPEYVAEQFDPEILPSNHTFRP